jgi:hypothetical protein
MNSSDHRSLWMSLRPGDIITFLKARTTVYAGFIEDRTDDGTVIWVIDSAGSRRLFHIDDELNFVVSGNVYA